MAETYQSLANILKASKRTVKKILERRPCRFPVQDSKIIAELKGKFIHTERETLYGDRRFIVDSLNCHALPGTLEVSILLISEFLDKFQKGSKPKLLNLGGGNGQVSQILRHLGCEVFNVDLEADPTDPNHLQFDLNDTSRELPYQKGSFDIVLCQEVIEHIENPWRLMRMISFALSPPRGVALITTPNVQSSSSRALFAKTGHFDWFTPNCLHYHVNPLFRWEMDLIAQKSGLVLTAVKGSGDYYFQRQSVSAAEVIAKNECLISTYQKEA